MTVRYPASKARVNFGEILDRVADRGDEVVILRLGKPVARISPYQKVTPTIEQLRKRLAKYAKGMDSATAVRLDRESH